MEPNQILEVGGPRWRPGHGGAAGAVGGRPASGAGNRSTAPAVGAPAVGLPPFAGFTGKWYLFVAVLQNYALPGGGWYAALAIIGAINSAVSLYYYMRIVRAMFLDASVATVGEVSIRHHRSYQILLGAFSVALLLFGVWWNPIVRDGRTDPRGRVFRRTAGAWATAPAN